MSIRDRVKKLFVKPEQVNRLDRGLRPFVKKSSFPGGDKYREQLRKDLRGE